MTKPVGFALLCLSLVLASALMTSVNAQTAGVAVGDKFTYTVKATWVSTDGEPYYKILESMNEINSVESMDFLISSIQTSSFEFQATAHFKNGTSMNATVRVGDSSVGGNYPDGDNPSLHDLLHGIPIFPSNANPNDNPLPGMLVHLSYRVNQTILMPFPDGEREVNKVIIHLDDFEEETYYDRKTGFLISRYAEAWKDEGIAITEINLEETNVWETSEFPSSIILPMYIVYAIAVAFVILILIVVVLLVRGKKE